MAGLEATSIDGIINIGNMSIINIYIYSFYPIGMTSSSGGRVVGGFIKVYWRDVV